MHASAAARSRPVVARAQRGPAPRPGLIRLPRYIAKASTGKDGKKEGVAADMAQAQEQVGRAQFYAINQIEKQMGGISDAQLELNAQAEALLRGLGLGDAAAKLKASNEEAEEALRKAKSQGANLKLVDAGLVQGESLLEQEMRLRASKTAGDGQGGSSSK